MSNADILITGATGFVGAALLEALRPSGRVRVMVRDATRLDADDGIEVVEGDLDDPQAVRRALAGTRIAYYLVHSMEPGDGEYAERDRQLAETFLAGAEAEGTEQLVYLGGVLPDGETSAHLRSRNEVEQSLGQGGPRLVALRASMIVGARSDSFRTLAMIVGRLPVLALPAWRDNRTQPVGIDDVVAALVAAPGVEPGSYNVAGPDEMSIKEMCAIIGELQGNERPALSLPFSSSRLESAAASLVADSDREVLEPLLEGMHEDLRVPDNALEPVFGVKPTAFRTAAARALAQLESRPSRPVTGAPSPATEPGT